MDVTLEDALRMLDEAAEQARSIRIELDDEYLRTIAVVEAGPRVKPPDSSSGSGPSPSTCRATAGWLSA